MLPVIIIRMLFPVGMFLKCYLNQSGLLIIDVKVQCKSHRYITKESSFRNNFYQDHSAILSPRSPIRNSTGKIFQNILNTTYIPH